MRRRVFIPSFPLLLTIRSKLEVISRNPPLPWPVAALQKSRGCLKTCQSPSPPFPSPLEGRPEWGSSRGSWGPVQAEDSRGHCDLTDLGWKRQLVCSLLRGENLSAFATIFSSDVPSQDSNKGNGEGKPTIFPFIFLGPVGNV